MSKFGANLPSVLEPLGEICVEVKIPAHPDYVKLFVRAIRMLEVNRMYARDNDLSAKVVVEQWRNRTITPLIAALAEGTGICQDLDGECLAYPPFASFLTYTPQDPFTDPELVPEGYEQPPFFVNGKDGSHDLPNYNKGDVIVDFGSVSLETGWDLSNTPTIDLCLEGSGVAEIHLLAIVQGGVAVVSLDNPIDVGDILGGIIGDSLLIVDLNQDIISLPPETATEIIQEIEIPTEGEHHLYITFLPIIDDSFIPLRFGGGLREISLCGNLRPCGMPPPPPPPPLDGVTELRPEFQFTADCGLEYRLRDQEDNIVQDWQAVAGWVDNAAACFSVGGGGMATKEDIRDALIEWSEELALRIGSGQIVPFSVDSDGEVVVGGEDGEGAGGIPDDDPATAFNEMLAAQAGGAIGVRTGFNEIWTIISARYVAGDSQVSVGQRLSDLFLWESVGQLDAFIANYYTHRAAAHSFVAAFTSVLDGYLFCKGNTKLVLSDWIYDTYTNAAQLEMSLFLKDAISIEQMILWYVRGVEVPSTSYVTYSCTKIPTEVFTINMALAESYTIPFAGTFKAGHRYLIEAEGSFTDADFSTKIQDFFWKKDNATGILTFIGFTLSVAGTTNATAAQVPYQPSHKYAWTFEKTGTDGGSFTKNNDEFNITGSPVVGTLTVTVTDLGEFAL